MEKENLKKMSALKTKVNKELTRTETECVRGWVG